MKPERRWKAPFPVGYPGAIDSMGSVAAPLLASVSAALATLVIPNERAFRWPELTVLLLIAATLTLITAVQCAFRARQYVVTPADLEQWYPISDASGIELRRQMQRYHVQKHEAWATWASRFYNAGLLCLLLGLALITLPPGHIGNERLVVAVLAFLGVASEVAWIVDTHLKRDLSVQLPEVGPEWNPSTSPGRQGDG